MRCGQRSSSTTALPSVVRKTTRGSPQISRASSVRPTSSLVATTYQALRTNIFFTPAVSGKAQGLNAHKGEHGLYSLGDRLVELYDPQDRLDRFPNMGVLNSVLDAFERIKGRELIDWKSALSKKFNERWDEQIGNA